MPLYIFSLRSRRLSHEIENDPFVEIYSRHELLSHSAEEEICSFIFMKLLKKHSILVAGPFVMQPYNLGTRLLSRHFRWKEDFKSFVIFIPNTKVDYLINIPFIIITYLII